MFSDAAVSADWVRAAAAAGSAGAAEGLALASALAAQPLVALRPGDFAAVLIGPVSATTMATVRGQALGRVESLCAFHSLAGSRPFFPAESALARASAEAAAARAAGGAQLGASSAGHGGGSEGGRAGGGVGEQQQQQRLMRAR